MYLSPLTQAREVEVNEVYRTWNPDTGFRLRPVVAVGASVLQPCVRLTSVSGAVLEVSRETPFDFADGTSALAYEMENRLVLVEDHMWVTWWEQIVRVEDIGMQWVVPISFSGLSFPAGADASLRIYSHNMAKDTGAP
jgi:hypothetical protein